jgi:hypothetical protein
LNEGIILNSAFGGEVRGQLPDGEWHTDARNSVHSIDDQGWRHHRRPSGSQHGQFGKSGRLQRCQQ